MSTTIRARVSQVGPYWIAAATQVGSMNLRIELAKSWPEAMQSAYALLANLDRELMDEVHASRSARRAAMDRHPAGKQLQEPTA